MSSQKSSGQTKYANSNLNGVFAKSSTSGSTAAGGVGFKTLSGMLVLQKKTRASTTATGTKLSVPKPVNLPSMKKEHAGNDPTTQLVPSGGSGSGWVKPEEPPAPPQPAEPRQSSLTAGSVWASTPRSSSGVAWQPPRDTVPVAARAGPSFPVDRHLNPEEYPSLAATAKAQSHPFKAVGRSALETQDTKSWADDERDVPHPSFRGSPGDWGAREERFEDDRGLDKPAEYGRGAWERERPSSRFDYEYGPPPPPPRGAAYDDDYDFRPRGPPSYDYGRGPYDSSQPPPPPGRRFGPPSGDRYGEPFYDGGRPQYDTSYDDRGLFPPPPPPKPAGQRESHVPAHQEDSDDVDLERQAFEAELARVAADLEKKKAEDKEAELHRARVIDEEPSEEEVKEEPETQLVPPPPPPPQSKRPEPTEPPQQKEPELTPEQIQEKKAAEKAAALAKAKALQEAAEAEEKRRKEAAAKKLRELEERIAQRKAEEAAKAEAAKAAAKAAAAALQPPKHAAASSSEPAEEDWEQAPDVVDAQKPSTPTGSRTAATSSTTADSTETVPQDFGQIPLANPNAWQQPLVPPARFGSFDDTLLANISKSSTEQPHAASEQTTTGQAHTLAKSDTGKDGEPPANGSRDSWRADAREESSEDAAFRGKGLRGDRGRGGRGERGRGRGRAGDSETDRPGSAQRSRIDNGSDSDASGRGGRGRGRSSIRGGRGGRSSAPTDDAATAAAMAAATAAVAAATAAVGDDKRGKPDSESAAVKSVGQQAQDLKSQDDVQIHPSAPATTSSAAAADLSAQAGDAAEFKGRKPVKTQRDPQPVPAVQPTSKPVGSTRAPVPLRSDRSRGPSPVPGLSSQPVSSAASSSHAVSTGMSNSAAHRVEQKKQQPDVPKASLGSSTSSSAPQNIPQRRPSSSADSAAFGWDNSIAKDVASMTLDEPVIGDAVHLPVSLDPTPPKQTAPIMNPGFERQIGPRHVAKERRHDMSDDPLDNRIPPLPAEILDGLPSPPKAASLPFAGPVPSGMNMRPLGPSFAFPAASDASPNPAAPGGHFSAVWGQPLSFGQPLHQPNLAAAVGEAWNIPLPMHSTPALAMSNNPSSSTPSIPAPPALMIGMGQFGQFGQHFTPPGPFNPPTQFGTLAQGFPQFPTSQPPFIPTGKQPDWSTGPGPMSIGSQTNPIGPGLRPGMLDSLLPPFSSLGPPQPPDAYRTPGLSPQGMGGMSGPGSFPPPPKQHSQEGGLRSPNAAPVSAAIGQQRDGPSHKDSAKSVHLPDVLTFGMEASATNPPKPPPGLSIHPGSRTSSQQLQAGQGHQGPHQHVPHSQQHQQGQQHPTPPQQQPSARPTSARGPRGSSGPAPERAGRGGPPQRGRGPPASAGRGRPMGGPGPSANGGPTSGPPGHAGNTLSDKSETASHVTTGNHVDGDGPNRMAQDAGRGGGRGRGDRGRADRGRGRGPPSTKTVYVAKAAHSNGSSAGHVGHKDK